MNALLNLLHSLNALLHNGHLPELGFWTYFLIFVLVAFEGPAVTLIAAAAASTGLLRPLLVFLFAAAGNLTSDIVWYSLGRAGKIDAWKRFGQKRGMDPEIITVIQNGINTHAIKIMFFAKLTMSLMIPTLITAGLSKVPFRKWFPAVFAGEMLWTGSLLTIGYFAARAIQRVSSILGYVTLGLSVAFILFLLWMGRRVLMKAFKGLEKSKRPEKKRVIHE